MMSKILFGYLVIGVFVTAIGLSQLLQQRGRTAKEYFTDMIVARDLGMDWWMLAIICCISMVLLWLPVMVVVSQEDNDRWF